MVKCAQLKERLVFAGEFLASAKAYLFPMTYIYVYLWNPIHFTRAFSILPFNLWTWKFRKVLA